MILYRIMYYHILSPVATPFPTDSVTVIAANSQPGCQPFDASHRLSPGQPAYAGHPTTNPGIWKASCNLGVSYIKGLGIGSLNIFDDFSYRKRFFFFFSIIWAEVVPQLRSVVPGSAPVVPTIVWESQMGMEVRQLAQAVLKGSFLGMDYTGLGSWTWVGIPQVPPGF